MSNKEFSTLRGTTSANIKDMKKVPKNVKEFLKLTTIINSMSDVDQIIVIRQFPDIIQYIKNPSETVKAVIDGVGDISTRVMDQLNEVAKPKNGIKPLEMFNQK